MPKYNDVILDDLLRVRNQKELSWEALADYARKRYGVLASGNALRKACASHNALQVRLLNADGTATGNFPIPFVQDYTDFITVPYADSMVVSDPHMPFYRADLADKMIKLAKKFGIKRLYITGDLFDGKAYSRFPTANDISQDDCEYELDIVGEFLRVCSTVFTDIYICLGNHDVRMLNKLERKIKFKTMLKAVISQAELGDTIIHVTEYPKILMKGDKKADTWLGHPDNYSRMRGRIPARLCAIYHANIVSSHTHHLCITADESGEYFLMETGCLSDRDKQEYIAMSFNDMPIWQEGFCMIMGERPFIFDDGLLTLWSMWLDGEE